MSAHISRPICDSRQYKCFLFLIFNGNFPFVILCVPSWTVHDCLVLSSALLKLNRKWYASSQCQWCLLGCLLWIFFVFFLVALNKFFFLKWNACYFAVFTNYCSWLVAGIKLESTANWTTIRMIDEPEIS